MARCWCWRPPPRNCGSPIVADAMIMPAAVIGSIPSARPDGDAERTEQQDVHDEHQGDTLGAVRGVDMALNPVTRCAMTILVERLLVFGLGAVSSEPSRSTLLMPEPAGCAVFAVSHLA